MHNSWRHYVYPIKNLTADKLTNATFTLHGGATLANAGEFWIDEIYFIKDVSKSDIDFKVNGNLTEGQILSVELVNPSNAEYYSLQVKNPNGDVVDYNAFTAIPGTYTIEFMYSYYYTSHSYTKETTCDKERCRFHF